MPRIPHSARLGLSALLGVTLVGSTLPPAWAVETATPSPEPSAEVEDTHELPEQESPDDVDETPAAQPDDDVEEAPGDRPADPADLGSTAHEDESSGEAGEPRVVVSEFNNGGPGGYHDNFIELANWGDAAQDVTGWTVYRCTGAGNQAGGNPQATLEGTLEPGEHILLARQHAQSQLGNDIVDYRYGTSFANESYGVIIRDADGEIVDRAGAKFPNVAGAACVEGTPLPNDTDSLGGESWQRVSDTDDNLADFVKAPRTPGEPNAQEPSPAPLGGEILISEVAHAGADGDADHLVEIGNYGTEPANLEGWELWRCNEWGQRFSADLLSGDLPANLEPGEAYVVETSQGFVTSRNNAGVMLRNGDDQLVDGVAWADNEHSACAIGAPLPHYTLDVSAGHSYQRIAAEGENTEAFVAALRGPGQLEANEPIGEEQQEQFLSTEGGSNVLVSEMTNNGPQGAGDIFFEITNYGDEPQDLSGWSVYRCIGTGVRASAPQLSEADLDGVVLEPGEILTVARAQQAGADIMAVADLYFDTSFADQYGLIIFDENARVVDRVGSAPAGVQNYCAQDYGSLPGTINGLYAESWQRVALTGSAAEDWHLAPRTPGRVNTREAWERPRVESPVRITELANGGPAGNGDNFVELTNLGDSEVSLGGMNVYRCAGTGRVHEQTRQLVLPQQTLAPGESFVIGRTNGFSGEADVWYGTSVAQVGGFGFVLTDQGGAIIDSVGVFNGVDSACTEGEALPNDLDFPAGETWHRVADSGNNREDFQRGARTPGEHGGEVVSVQPEVLEPGDVQIVEIAAGGPADLSGEGSEGFLELANRGEDPVDVSEWEIYFCSSDGRRIPQAQYTFERDSTLEPGEVFTLANPEPAEGMAHDAVANIPLGTEGYGALITNGERAVVDRVGVFYSYSGAVTNAPPSLCTGELSLDYRVAKESQDKAFQHGFSWHRVQYTGDNYEDYVAAERDPGQFVQLEYRDPLIPEEGALDPVQTDRYVTPEPAQLSSVPAETEEPGQELTVQAGADGLHTARGGQVEQASVTYYSGVSAAAPLDSRVGAEETEQDGETVAARDSQRGFPYVRMELDLEGLSEQTEVVWTGSSENRNELQMYVWNGTAWELRDARAAENGAEITLIAPVDAQDVQDGIVNVLVQDGPRTGEGLDHADNLAFQTPGTYDFSVGHLTDTQYTAEQNPWVYTAMNAWFVANMEARDIAFQMHTGDIIENALRGNQLPDRAVREFEKASVIQELLEESGLPHAVLPGNHDNFWGNNNDLYLEYFPEERYSDYDWYGAAGPLGNSSSYSTIERDGVKMLFLSMAYYAHERELQWAEEVIASHPDHNVIMGTHEYLRPEVDERANPDNGRWAAQGDIFYERLVKPHSNVVMVMSGHLHGIRQREEATQDDRWVVEMVADFQSYEHEGGRTALFNRLMQIDVDGGEVAINAYSPVYDSFEPHLFQPSERDDYYGPEHNEAVLSIDLMWDKAVLPEGLTVLTGVEELSSDDLESGRSRSVTWENLSADHEYGWYALATSENLGRSDENRPSAVNIFTAASGESVPEEPEDEETPAPSEPGVEPTAPGADPSDPGVEPSEPGAEPTEPGADPSEPGAEPSDPGAEPTDPGADPSDPGVEPSEPGAEPGDPSVEPSDPGAEPSDPGNEPSRPSVQPTDPSVVPTDPGTPGEGEPSASEVPSPTDTSAPSGEPSAEPTPTPEPSATETPQPGRDASTAPGQTASPSPTAPPGPSAEDLLAEFEDLIRVLPASILTPGGELIVEVDAEFVGAELSGVLFSDPLLLGTAEVSSEALVTFSIPEEAEAGDHRVALYDADGQLIGWTAVTLTVEGADGSAETEAPGDTAAAPDGVEQSAGGLAVTGATGAWIGGSALVLLVMGLLLIAAVRHRRTLREEHPVAR
ncbi:lamin tail domain-containing protein [Nesterenkonia flava]|uniref:Lamin tail domain-containing protein n=1 Tax=Nesterenkonia flava TaxID=469799 RepID=A0ABU1FRV6_9MICC|nr:lamin tail domain-containing protein [Nesterenkonia flava]MDR5710977.1 lamin tail domain-containing protein [Nesterenkonia flava]